MEVTNKFKRFMKELLISKSKKDLVNEVEKYRSLYHFETELTDKLYKENKELKEEINKLKNS